MNVVRRSNVGSTTYYSLCSSRHALGQFTTFSNATKVYRAGLFKTINISKMLVGKVSIALEALPDVVLIPSENDFHRRNVAETLGVGDLEVESLLFLVGSILPCSICRIYSSFFHLRQLRFP